MVLVGIGTHLMLIPYPSDSQTMMTLSLSELEARYRPSLFDQRTQRTAPKRGKRGWICQQKGEVYVCMYVSHTAVPSQRAKKLMAVGIALCSFVENGVCVPDPDRGVYARLCVSKTS